VKAGYLKRNEVTKEILNGKDDNTNRLLLHPHCLRKYFRGYFGSGDLSEYLMGHSTLMTKTYRKMTPEDLSKKYLEHMGNVTFYTPLPDLTGINESLKQKDIEITNLKTRLDAMTGKETRINELETQLRIISARLDNLKENLLNDLLKKAGYTG
jgi:hypothetical protein